MNSGCWLQNEAPFAIKFKEIPLFRKLFTISSLRQVEYSICVSHTENINLKPVA